MSLFSSAQSFCETSYCIEEIGAVSNAFHEMTYSIMRNMIVHSRVQESSPFDFKPDYAPLVDAISQYVESREVIAGLNPSKYLEVSLGLNLVSIDTLDPQLSSFELRAVGAVPLMLNLQSEMRLDEVIGSFHHRFEMRNYVFSEAARELRF